MSAACALVSPVLGRSRRSAHLLVYLPKIKCKEQVQREAATTFPASMPALEQEAMAAPVQQAAEEEEDWSDDDDNEYMLGFVDEAAPATLLRHRFPSKVGGRPAWLDPVHLPTQDQLTCKATGKPLNFLLQVYAPLDDAVAHDAAFHRSLFMFVTPEGKMIHKPGAVRAFRCQLPRRNNYYSYDPPTSLLPPALPAEQQEAALAADPWKVLQAEAALASASSGKGKTKGSKSQQPASTKAADTAAAISSGVTAASQGMQDLSLASDDTSATEGQAATSSALAKAGSSTSQTAGLLAAPSSKALITLYLELELIVEPEVRETEEEQAVVQKLMSEYAARVDEEGELDDEELPAEVVEQVEDNATLEQKHFAMFQARIEPAPDQVIRYCFREGAQPLWPSPRHQPAPQDIPPCPHCKQQRRFEFQVMPQLLNELGQDELSESALDWSTVAVYSCPTSCAAGTQAAMVHGSAYVEEFVWVQPAL